MTIWFASKQLDNGVTKEWTKVGLNGNNTNK